MFAPSRGQVIRLLNLHSTRIGDPGAIALAKMLETNPILEELDLHYNRVGCVAGAEYTEAG